MRKLLCILSALMICLMIQANGRKISFNHLNIEDGLSSISIHDLWLDPSGVIWIATASGLDCFDGNSIVPASSHQENHQGMPKTVARQLTGDEDGHLYVLYPRQIGILDTRTGKTGTFFSGRCNCITYSNGLWAGSKNDLLYSESPDSPLKKVWATTQEDGEITCILRAQDGSFWFGTSLGKIIHTTDGFSIIKSDAASGSLHSKVYTIYEDSRKTIWAGTLNDGCTAISKDGRLARFTHDSGRHETISSNYIRSFCEDNLGNIWIGTYTGLDCLDPLTGDITRYNPELMRPDGISHSSICTSRADTQRNTPRSSRLSSRKIILSHGCSEPALHEHSSSDMQRTYTSTTSILTMNTRMADRTLHSLMLKA
jgi:ligand-binding sensor domain-containing protein